jgi:imidazolonepropionase
VEARPDRETARGESPPVSVHPEIDLLIISAGELVTVAGGTARPLTGAALDRPAVIPNGAVAVAAGQVADVGTTDAVLSRVQTGPNTRVIDAAGRAVIPGFVDAHTHLVFAGSREDEFAMRLQGATYQEIAARGGGIMSTVRATRQATREELVAAGLRRLDELLLVGTTTVEIKSGYGLTVEDEEKQLRAVRELSHRHPIDIVPTFMGAHEIPPEYRSKREDYIRLIIEEMLPRAAAGGEGRLAWFCDVFTEKGVFTVEESRQILLAGRAHGLVPKVHADELSPLGGSELAAEVGAISADHLLHASDEGLRRMAQRGTVAVCLPGTAFCLMNVPYANARRMVELGCAVAIASDFNPGSCPTYSMPFIITLACMQMKLTPSEALAAATINAAHAIGMAGRVGSIEVGKQADLVILDAPNHRQIPYRMGTGLVYTVIKNGRVVVEERRLVRR